MRQKRIVIGIMLIFLLIAIGIPSTMVYQELHKQRGNRALIASIYRNDEKTVVSLLKQGADANTCDEKAPAPTLRGVVALFLEQLRGRRPTSEQTAHSALIVALGDSFPFSPGLPDPDGCLFRRSA